jgi:hypothetical protein
MNKAEDAGLNGLKVKARRRRGVTTKERARLIVTMKTMTKSETALVGWKSKACLAYSPFQMRKEAYIGFEQK